MRPESWLLLVLGALAGCNSLPRLPERVPDPVPSSETIQAAQLNSYASALQRIVGGSPTEQAEVLTDARVSFEQARQGPAVLRYALLLAAPLHAGRDPLLAQQLLHESLARPELLSEIERALANLELERMNAELRLAAENERLVTEARVERERVRSGPSAAGLSREVKALTEQNAQLRRSLDEARAKLDQIAEFERRQADRPPAAEVRNP